MLEERICKVNSTNFAGNEKEGNERGERRERQETYQDLQIQTFNFRSLNRHCNYSGCNIVSHYIFDTRISLTRSFSIRTMCRKQIHVSVTA